MLGNHDLGAALFKTWTEQQRHDEIGRLVEGFRNGMPVGVLCKMAETIAGDRKRARRHLQAHMPLEERQAAVAGESGGMRPLVESFLL